MRTEHPAIEAYMHSCMADSAHDMEHVYRVLYYALDIAKHEGGVDIEALSAACLLHDIGRPEQFADPRVDHAVCGGEKARAWLLANGYSDAFANTVRDCIRTHRYRSNGPPRSIEAKILFDADKLEACGATGIARTLLYKAQVDGPLYLLDGDGGVSDGTGDADPSFFKEYKFKLENVYDKFYTRRGAELAEKRREAAKNFYEALLREVRECYANAQCTMYNAQLGEDGQ
jgi:uncharacterized protein